MTYGRSHFLSEGPFNSVQVGGTWFVESQKLIYVGTNLVQENLRQLYFRCLCFLTYLKCLSRKDEYYNILMMVLGKGAK